MQPMKCCALAVVAAMLLLGVTNAKKHFVVYSKASHDFRVVEGPYGSVGSGDSNSEFATADVAAIVDYNDTLLTTGWARLNVTTNPLLDDMVQAYAAGYGEGFLTLASVWDNYNNNQFEPNQPPYPENISTWVHKNWEWMEEQVLEQNSTSMLWYHVGLQMEQFRGLLGGLNAAAGNDTSRMMSFDALQSMNLQGDLMDLYAILNISLTATEWRSMSKPEFQSWFARSTHCSALVKLKYDYSDIFFGHATWSTYNMMVRSYKTYTLNFASAAAKTISFSGYAGVLASIDDFYVGSNGLAVTETSFSILNASLYQYCQPTGQIFYWIRALVATRIATSGKEWTTVFSDYNSGTYNNQWIVLDTNLFTPGQDLQPGTLYIAEQIPGQVGVRDVTSTLQYGYWPSYNIPSIREIYVLSGNEEAAQTQGWEMNDYDRCVRAQIFRRDQANVHDLDSMQFIMQYNNYEFDSVSMFNPTYTIAARGDLLPGNQSQCFGAIDAKITSYTMMQQGQKVSAYSGPTPQQPPFNANQTNATLMCSPHYGQPILWNFSFVTMLSKL